MVGPGGRRGRIDNGLVAAEYAVAGDVDPRVGEHLLDVLGAGGIAAYLSPSADVNPVTRTTTIPARPIDRLYVDRAHLQTARDYLKQLTAEPAETTVGAAEGGSAATDVDAEWAKIVAGFDAEAAEPRQTWPESENVAGTEPETPPTIADRTGHPAGTGLVKSDYAERSLLDGLDTFGAHLPDDDTDGYTPPPPPPLPKPSRTVVLAVIGILCGLILFLRPQVAAPLFSESLAMIIALSAILTGFVALIWRLRPGTEDDEDHDPDNGAVV